MACSKICSGDLPELINEVIQYFRYDYKTLHSCILVNRLWCHLAIPLLWEDPFSNPTKNYYFIEIYLCFLNEDGKAKFNEYGINNLLLSNKLFNYPSFIKYLDTNKICNSIKYWVDTLMDKYDDNLKNLVYRSLFEVFIENEGSLHSFEAVLSIGNSCNYFSNNMDLILQNPNLINNIRGLTFRGFGTLSQNIIPFLKLLYSNCNSISSIIINFPKYIFMIDNYPLIEKCLTQIIISQHNLKKISFGSFVKLYNPFLSLKNSNCSNTLNTIIFYLINFKNIINILQEVFDHLNVLESIHLIYCEYLNSDSIQQIIKVTKPFKLKTLIMSEIIHIESLLLLLQKFGDCLENFGFGNIDEIIDEYNEPKRQLFEFITKYCKKIRYFESGLPDDNNTYLFIKNNQHNINYLTIEADFHDHYAVYNVSSTVLRNLGQVLPSKLEYLCLTLIFTTNDLEIFLKNSQNTFIKKLLIKQIIVDEDENIDISFYIKKYIMKKERVKYLAILKADFNDKELFFLKDEVNEFKLHNIVVKKYNELHIDTYSYVNNYLQY
ncbi:hypothetical protein RhiirC2_855549 [Rhizophagus irregularis]|uniref:F-box domain-containing protein n=1 Tax=Rhizophagus irregularis TaxID=588596 RepID=A0A2N1MLV9_9GLOM|nr:hypothetical protein RhiirC2_855549 [Rhizophagus irregularis]